MEECPLCCCEAASMRVVCGIKQCQKICEMCIDRLRDPRCPYCKRQIVIEEEKISKMEERKDSDRKEREQNSGVPPVDFDLMDGLAQLGALIDPLINELLGPPDNGVIHQNEPSPPYELLRHFGGMEELIEHFSRRENGVDDVFEPDVVSDQRLHQLLRSRIITLGGEFIEDQIEYLLQMLQLNARESVIERHSPLLLSIFTYLMEIDKDSLIEKYEELFEVYNLDTD